MPIPLAALAEDPVPLGARRPWYATRDEFMAATEVKATAYARTQIDSCLDSASRDVERLLHYTNLYPAYGTRYWDYPNDQEARSGRIWLDDSPLLSLTAFTAGGVDVPSGNYILEPNRSGPPYRSVNIDRSTTSALASGNGTGQRALALTGTWGLTLDEETAGTLTTTADSTTTSIAVDAPVGVGALLRVGTERMIVTQKAFTASGQTGSLAQSNAATSLSVSDGSVFAAGEELIIDTERLMVEDVLGNTLVVKRAFSGSPLAAHTTAPIYWPRTLTVVRAAAGSTTASQGMDSPVYRWLSPAPVTELTLAYALDRFFQRGSGYARTVGSGDAERQSSGRGIRELEERVLGAYGRNLRSRAV